MRIRVKILLGALFTAAVLISTVVAKDYILHRNKIGVIYWHGDNTKNEIALTFDDGPNEPYTSQVLAILKEQNVKATFFLVGKNVEKYPDSVKAIVHDGHAIGNHTYSHPDLIFTRSKNVNLQLARTEKAIETACGVRPVIFRPPFGADDPFTLRESQKLGYIIVKWSISSKDWEMPGAQRIIENVLPHVESGSIILMHDGNKDLGGDRSQTVEAIKTIIPELKKKGFTFVTVPALLDIEISEHPSKETAESMLR